ncbi:ABC transporter, putative, partial [Bodo saltans]
WDSLAQANSHATEAFSNIRTVKAFSTEAFELDQFSKTMGVALAQTTRDAVANAGSIFASSTLDLGQAIIILAFGGLMAISTPEDLSVGQLVTFQLYVNMMNGAYQSLNGVLNEFTKSAGAAERVLTMLDAKSSIDPRVGEVIPDMLFNGTLAFDRVVFRY